MSSPDRRRRLIERRLLDEEEVEELRARLLREAGSPEELVDAAFYGRVVPSDSKDARKLVRETLGLSRLTSALAAETDRQHSALVEAVLAMDLLSLVLPPPGTDPRGRSRKVPLGDLVDTARAAALSSRTAQVAWDDGGGVPNSYRGRADTDTALVVVWPSGVAYVHQRRVGAPSRPYGHVSEYWGLSQIIPRFAAELLINGNNEAHEAVVSAANRALVLEGGL